MTNNQLLKMIEDYLKTTGKGRKKVMTWSRFGRTVMGDSRFVLDLRRGKRTLTEATISKVTRFIKRGRLG